MIIFFRSKANTIYAVDVEQQLETKDIQKLTWLFHTAELLTEKRLEGYFVGPRKEMITPWSTNAVEITQTMGIAGIQRIEEFFVVKGADAKHDRMLQVLYTTLDQDLFTIHHTPEPILAIDDIGTYSAKE